MLGEFPERVRSLRWGRRVLNKFMVYLLSFRAFLFFLDRLILIVFSKIQKTPTRLPVFLNKNSIFFGFLLGDIDTGFYKNLMRCFVKKFREKVRTDAVCRVFVCIINSFQFKKVFMLFFVLKFLICLRFPLFLNEDDSAED